MGNLLSPEKFNIPIPKIDISKITTVDEEEEIDVEERMKRLPHWKYAASFRGYIDELQTVTPEVKAEFMALFESKKYKKIYDYLCKNKILKKYFDNFVMEAGEEDKSPEIMRKKKLQEQKAKKLSKHDNLELKPYYMDKAKVQSRLFGAIQNDKEKKVDWKNLEKLSKEAIGKADMPLPKLMSLSKVLENELVRLKKLDEKLNKELAKIKVTTYQPHLFRNLKTRT